MASTFPHGRGHNLFHSAIGARVDLKKPTRQRQHERHQARARDQSKAPTHSQKLIEQSPIGTGERPRHSPLRVGRSVWTASDLARRSSSPAIVRLNASFLRLFPQGAFTSASLCTTLDGLCEKTAKAIPYPRHDEAIPPKIDSRHKADPEESGWEREALIPVFRVAHLVQSIQGTNKQRGFPST